MPKSSSTAAAGLPATSAAKTAKYLVRTRGMPRILHREPAVSRRVDLRSVLNDHLANATGSHRWRRVRRFGSSLADREPRRARHAARDASGAIDGCAPNRCAGRTGLLQLVPLG